MKRPFGNGIYSFIMSVFNLIAAVGCTTLYFLYPDAFDVLEPGGFLRRFSPLHIVWVVWFINILLRFIPVKSLRAPGSDKIFAYSYVPTGIEPRGAAYEKFRKTCRKQALLMALLWLFCVLICGAFALCGIFTPAFLFLLCAWLYAFDGLFLSSFCPFRVFIMKNRCCKTCRIHGWDRLMALSPLFFAPGFCSLSLILPSAVLLILWELAYIRHPERFWAGSNRALHCAECSEKLCDNYINEKKIKK